MGERTPQPDPKYVEDYIDKIYHESFVQLYAYAVSALGSESEAEEAVQEVYVVACEKPRKLIDSPNPRGWLMNTLKNVIMDTRRSHARLNSLILKLMPLSWNDAVTGVEDAPSVAGLCYEQMLVDTGLLTETEYEMLVHIAFDGYTMMDLAREYDLPLETCKKRVQRARKKAEKIVDHRG